MTYRIEDNIFYQTAFGLGQTAPVPDDVKAGGLAMLLTFTGIPKVDQKALKDFGYFKIYLELENERIIRATDRLASSFVSRLQDYLKEIEGQAESFNKAAAKIEERDDPQFLADAAQDCTVKQKISENRILADLIREGASIDRLMADNETMLKLYFMLVDACDKAEKQNAEIRRSKKQWQSKKAIDSYTEMLGLHIKDIRKNYALIDFTQLSIRLQKAKPVNRARIRKMKELFSSQSAELTVSMNKVVQAARDAFNAAHRAPLVLDKEVEEAIAALDVNTKARPRNSINATRSAL